MTARIRPALGWSTERIRLRALETEHIEFFASLPHDAEIERQEDAVGFPLSTGFRRARLTGLAAPREDDSFFWVIEDIDGEVAGAINTFDCDSRAGTFRFALFVLTAFRRRGYASDAIRLVLQHYFYERRYQKAAAKIYAFNEASLRLHRRLGFVEEGRLRRAVFTDEKFFDEVLVGLLAEELDCHG